MRWLTLWPSATVSAQILRCPHAGYLQRVRVHDRDDAVGDRARPRPLRHRAAERPLTLAIPRRSRDARQRAEPSHVKPRREPDHLQLLEAKSAPPRLSSRSSTCASPSADVTCSSSRSSCASRADGPCCAPASSAPRPPWTNWSRHLAIDVSEQLVAPRRLGDAALAAQHREHDPLLLLRLEHRGTSHGLLLASMRRPDPNKLVSRKRWHGRQEPLDSIARGGCASAGDRNRLNSIARWRLCKRPMTLPSGSPRHAGGHQVVRRRCRRSRGGRVLFVAGIRIPTAWDAVASVALAGCAHAAGVEQHRCRLSATTRVGSDVAASAGSSWVFASQPSAKPPPGVGVTACADPPDAAAPVVSHHGVGSRSGSAAAWQRPTRWAIPIVGRASPPTYLLRE